jgi:uncharacterized OB-fold protein
MEQVPLVDYLKLGEEPHLRANECVGCGARFFDRRNPCAHCSRTDFRGVRVSTTGRLRAFTIVTVAAPGVPVPFVAGVVDCAGTRVRANVVNTPPDVRHVQLGMPLRLVTYSVGVDKNGVEAIGFGFEPDQKELAHVS